MKTTEPAVLLVVDDEPSVRAAVRRALRRETFEVVEADRGSSALDILKQRRVDIIVSDHVMPEMTGLELLRLCRVMAPDAVRILMTGQADLEVAVRAINENAVFRFVHKPWDVEQLRLTLQLAARHGEAQRRAAQLLADARAREAQAARARRTVVKGSMAAAGIQRNHRGAIVIPLDYLESPIEAASGEEDPPPVEIDGSDGLSR